MTIRNLGTTPGTARSTGPVPPRTTPAAGTPAASTPAASTPAVRTATLGAGQARSLPERRDSVQISDAARALGQTDRAAAAGPVSGTERRQPLSAERVDELRKKVLEGAYNQLHVVDQVARRIAASGDL